MIEPLMTGTSLFSLVISYSLSCIRVHKYSEKPMRRYLMLTIQSR
jgi:hypothetical protein